MSSNDITRSCDIILTFDSHWVISIYLLHQWSIHEHQYQLVFYIYVDGEHFVFWKLTQLFYFISTIQK